MAVGLLLDLFDRLIHGMVDFLFKTFHVITVQKFLYFLLLLNQFGCYFT